MKRRSLIIWLGSSTLLPSLAGAVRGDKTMYVGGSLGALPDKTVGYLDLVDPAVGHFNSKKGTFRFAYSRITSLEYGQKAGRRVGVAIAVSPLFLLSKKRKHFLTIGFADDDGRNQGVVLELSKGKVRSVLSTLEARSGQQVEYESEEARKHAGN